MYEKILNFLWNKSVNFTETFINYRKKAYTLIQYTGTVKMSFGYAVTPQHVKIGSKPTSQTNEIDDSAVNTYLLCVLLMRKIGT